jgi:2-amino-4-hydroxy-6-hydroxymethyldihydropteridine diphosphokinase
VGFSGGNFLNLVVAFECEAPPEQVAAKLRAIEERFGRDRAAPRLGPRTLDIDLLLYNDLVRNDGDVRLPREDVTRYAFVLRPLAEMAPDLRHPVTGQRFAEIWSAFDQSSQKLWPAPAVPPAAR